MTNILIYDIEAEMLEDLATKNDLAVADIIEMLAEKIEEVKVENDLI